MQKFVHDAVGRLHGHGMPWPYDSGGVGGIGRGASLYAFPRGAWERSKYASTPRCVRCRLVDNAALFSTLRMR